ncbi:fimbria/pilus periplasmic chaperone, partial [Escherichia coli]|nr:fimbria/pilus periplasmic chaperone [Escherichia coli]
FYFNVREIPPKSDKPNPLQIALQTRIKLFWRPKALENTSMKSPWQHKVTLTRSGQAFTVNNPTPYYVIISNASAQKNGNPATGFSPLVIEPKTTVPLNVKMDSVPVLTYVNDFGARMPLFFRCDGNTCQVDKVQSLKG